MKPFREIALLGALLLLTACDPLWGVSRRATIPFLPPPEKVRAVISEVPKVEQVNYRFSYGGRPITLTGLKRPNQIHTFEYRGTNIRGIVQFTATYKHGFEYGQFLGGYEAIRPTNAQELVDSTLPVMREIESGLERECGLTNLQNDVVQHCLRIRCK